MDTEPGTETMHEADEISLVDILSIVIKRRLIVLAATVFGLALGLWFFYGDISRSDRPLYTATQDVFFYDPVIKNPKAVIENFVLGPQFKAAFSAASSIKPDTLSVSYNEAKLLLTIEVHAQDKDAALAGPAQALAALKASYALMETRRSALALALLNGSTSGASLESLPFELYAIGDTRLSVPKAEWQQKAILSLFACLFMGFLLAFMAESFDRLRADPEARKKLRDAWGRRA